MSLRISRRFSLIIIIVSLTLLGGCLDSSVDDGSGEDVGVDVRTEDKSVTLHEERYLGDGETSHILSFTIPKEDKLVEIYATATWMDEPDIQRVREYENYPEKVALRVEEEGGFSKVNVGQNFWGSPGVVVVYHADNGELDKIDRERKIDVFFELLEAEDYYPKLNSGGDTDKIEDPGNDFAINITYSYRAPV